MAVDIHNDRAYRYDDLADFPDDNLRREIMDGELVVTPAPDLSHQTVVLELGARLWAWSRQHGGRVFVAPLDVFFADDNVVEPDVLFVRAEHTDRLEEKVVRGPPDIVVEVSSPSSRRLELVRKRELYERHGVTEYWYVDRDAERIERYRLEGDRYGYPERLGRGDELVSVQVPGFAVAVEELLPPADE